MKSLAGVRSIFWVPFVIALVLPPVAALAQDGTEQSPGIKLGDYDVQQSVEFG